MTRPPRAEKSAGLSPSVAQAATPCIFTFLLNYFSPPHHAGYVSIFFPANNFFRKSSTYREAGHIVAAAYMKMLGPPGVTITSTGYDNFTGSTAFKKPGYKRAR